MKTKAGLFLLFSIFFQFTLNAQTIYGPSFICIGECELYEVIDDNGEIMNDDFIWDLGDGTIINGPNAEICPWWTGGVITLSDQSGVVIATFQYIVDCCTFNFIDGPTELCVGECATYYADNGQGAEWFVSGGDIVSIGPSTMNWCSYSPGIYEIIVTDFNGCSSSLAVAVTEVETPEIISLSGAFCLDDSLSNCDRVCENTTVTYTTEVNSPGQSTNWFVSGAESWEENGNEVIVEWGDPGQGLVSVVVGNGLADPWFMFCGDYLEAQFGANDGTGLVGIDGPPGGSYEVSIDNSPDTYSITGNNYVLIPNLPAGIYGVTVTDQNGLTQSCEMTINETDMCTDGFGLLLDVTPPTTDLNCCDGSIGVTIIGNPLPTAPFAYLWSTGETTAVPSDLCDGTYSVTVYDSNGCSAAASVSLFCSQPQSCSGSNSLCVDILETPEAAFETNPPAVNGVVEICQGQTVFFDNQTNGAFSYTWDFGNGVSSSLVDAEHTYLSAGTYEAILIARNDCFCGDSTSVTIIVEESFSPEIDCAGTVCPGEEITYTANADCSTFYWNVSSNGTIISGGNTSDDFITVDWGAGPEGIIELSVDGCNGDYCLQTMVESIPIIDDNAEIQGPPRVCKGAEVIYTMPAYAGTEFIWTVSSFGTITEGQGSNEITIQWADEVTPIQQQITVDYESCYLGCGGQDTLLVNILNEIFIEGPIEACPDQMALYSCTTPLGSNVQAEWTVSDNTGTVVASSGGFTSDFTINWNFPSGTYIVHAEVQNPTSYCIDNFSVFVEVVQPTALPISITGLLEICPGTTYTYSGNSGAGTYDYTWYVTDGGSNYILNGKTVNIAWGGAPPYLLELTQTNLDGFSCESESIAVNPNSISTVALTGTPFVCYEKIGTYTATDYPDLDYTWQILPLGAGTIIGEDNLREVNIQWNDPGTHDVQVTVCGVSSTFSVTVYPPPNPVLIYNDVCPGQTDIVSLTLPYTAYEWRNESGIPIGNGPTINLGTGHYEVIVTNNNGCTGNETFYVGTYGQPDVTISTPDFGNFCQNGGSMTLYALESSSGPLDYQWFFNGTPFGSNSSSQVITSEGTYYVMITDINGCTANSNTLGLNCSSLPGSPQPGCTPDGFVNFGITQGVFCNESQYTNTSLNDAPNTWTWEFWDIVGGGIDYSNQENPTHTWTNAGFNLVVFRAGIYSTPPGQICPMVTYSFDTIPLAANFISEGNCALEPVTFTDISTFIPQTNITGWSWDFGDPGSGANNTSTLQNPQHIYNTSGWYTVILTVTDLSGCISQHQLNVEITAPPLASFVIPDESCEGASLLFLASGNFTDVLWDFGDPASDAANTSTSSQAYHTYTTPGTYTVTLSVENVYGCSESVSQQVNIEANGLTGVIAVNPGTEVCEGDSVILRAPMADSYLWSTGAVTQEITTFEAGTYEVSIYDPIGCGYTTPPVSIDLIPLPQGQITAVEYNEYDQPTNYYYDNYETCYGEDVYLEITENLNYTYQWSNGDVGTEISFTDDKENLLEVGTHVFETTITDTNTGCTNVVGPFTVTVHPVPEDVIITSTPAAPVCENTPTVMSVSNPVATYTYIWNTGQTGTSISTFYAGQYFVRAINEFGCEGESNTLEIVPGPNVDLIPSGCHARCNPDTICLPPITGIANFQWYFNGAAVPAPQGNDPDFIAMESGEYYVEMISDLGCVTISDVLTLDLYDGFGSVQGTVYFDLNENGLIDAADTLMSGIGVILQNGGTNLDTLVSNQTGSISFSNILSTNYELIIDELNLPEGMSAVISQANANLFGCDDEESVAFLIEFICAPLSETVTLQACPGSTVDYNGTDLAIGTTTDFLFINPAGCDSTVTVMVDALQTYAVTENLEACPGTTVDYNGVSVLAGTTMDFNLTTTENCDSIVTVVVAELTESTGTVELQACTGSTIDYNGTALSAGAVMDFTFDNSLGCDSIVTVTVLESEQDSSSIQLATCIGTTIDYDGTALDVDTQTDFLFTNTSGCDSIVTVMVGALQTHATTETFQTCPGTTVDYNGTDLAVGSQTDFVLSNVNGCDSVVTVTVSALQTHATAETLEACPGTTVDYNGTSLAVGSQTDFVLSNVNGCDSVVTVTVNGFQTYTETENLQACAGTTVSYNGVDLLAGTTMDFNLSTVNNCDSIVTVVVESLSLSTSMVNMEACNGNTVDYNGTALNPGTSTDFMFMNMAGCDSMVTVMVAELPLYDLDMELSACEGETVAYNGENLAAGSVTQFMFTSSAGCDSAMTVTVGSIPVTTATLNVAACEDGNYFYNGTAIAAGSSADFTLTNAGGCDSILTVNVASLSLTESFIDLFVCSGESINYNGTELFEGFEDAITLTDLNGCDSIVTVRVEAYPVFDFAVAHDASCWNERNGVIYVEDIVGGTGPFQYGVDGYYQDSTTFVNMNDGTYTISVMDANGCEESLSTEVSEITRLEIEADVPEIPCDFSTVRLSLNNISENSGTVSYLWENGSIESFIDVDTPGIYTVAIANACEVLQKEYTVQLAADGRANYFYVPNVFSPNDDGMNDLWKIMPPDNMEVLSFELQVFDRWGNHLKTFGTTDDTWDGKFNSEMLDPGVYVWWYRATVVSCGRALEVFDYGDVTMVK